MNEGIRFDSIDFFKFRIRMKDSNNSVELLEIQREIHEAYNEVTFNQYMNLLRKWMSGRMTLELFDKQAQTVISLDLHTKFLLSIMDHFESSRRFDEPNWQIFQSRTTPGWLPNHRMIKAWALITAFEQNLEGVDSEAVDQIFEHLQVGESIDYIVRHFIF